MRSLTTHDIDWHIFLALWYYLSWYFVTPLLMQLKCCCMSWSVDVGWLRRGNSISSYFLQMPRHWRLHDKKKSESWQINFEKWWTVWHFLLSLHNRKWRDFNNKRRKSHMRTEVWAVVHWKMQKRKKSDKKLRNQVTKWIKSAIFRILWKEQMRLRWWYNPISANLHSTRFFAKWTWKKSTSIYKSDWTKCCDQMWMRNIHHDRWLDRCIHWSW